MTQTTPAEPDRRHTVDSITSDQLDQLYGELDRLRARVQDWRTSTGAGLRLVDELRAERDALAAGVPLVCSDERHTTKVFALQAETQQLLTNGGKAIEERAWAQQRAEERAERAEATLTAVRALAERWQHTGDRKDGPLRELRAVLDQHGQTPA